MYIVYTVYNVYLMYIDYSYQYSVVYFKVAMRVVNVFTVTTAKW